MEWIAEQESLLQGYFPVHSDVILERYRNEGRFPSFDAPVFDTPSGLVALNTELGVTADEGVIYYTVDGSDPRLVGGEVSPDAQVFSDSITLQADVTISTRLLREGEWSALNRADFEIRSDMPLRITEVHAAPHSANIVAGLDEPAVDAIEFQFVEITNIGDTTVDLAGVQLIEPIVEFSEQGVTFNFTSQILEPGEQLVVAGNIDAFTARYGTEIAFAQGSDGVGGPEGQFGGELAADGETMTLVDANGIAIQRFDYGRALATHERAEGIGSSLEIVDTSQRYEGSTNWLASVEFGGTPGQPLTSPSTSDVLINELSVDANHADSWIELHNTSDQDVSVGGWYLSNSPRDLFQAQIPADATIPAGGYLSVDQSDFGFPLDARGGGVWLVASDESGAPLRFANQVQYPVILPGVTSGRTSDGGDVFEQLSFATRNRENASVLVGDIIISEVNYAPADADGADNGLDPEQFEYIELFNRTPVDVDLRNWTLSGDVNLRFRSNSVIPAGETMVVLAIRDNRTDLTRPFRNAYGINASVALKGAYSGTLNDVAGSLQLNRPISMVIDGLVVDTFAIVDRVDYESDAPWPASHEESGLTLTRTSLADGRRDSSWDGAAPSPGSTDLPQQIFGDSNGDGQFTSDDIVAVMIAGKYESAVAATFAQGDWNRDGFFNMEDFVDALAAGRYES